MTSPKNKPQDADDPELVPRDPEDRVVRNAEELKEKTFDKTDADSFPASDPPSSIPDPSAADSFAA